MATAVAQLVEGAAVGGDGALQVGAHLLGLGDVERDAGADAVGVGDLDHVELAPLAGDDGGDALLEPAARGAGLRCAARGRRGRAARCRAPTASSGVLASTAWA